jgi:hypothetical protein
MLFHGHILQTGCDSPAGTRLPQSSTQP